MCDPTTQPSDPADQASRLPRSPFDFSPTFRCPVEAVIMGKVHGSLARAGKVKSQVSIFIPSIETCGCTGKKRGNHATAARNGADEE